MVFGFLFGTKETPEELEKRTLKASEELAAKLGEPEEGQEQDAAYLRRFVVANELDVQKAADHVKQERDWRKKTLPITLTEKEQEVMDTKRIEFLGVNPDGIAIMKFDFMNGKFLDGFTPEQIINAQIHESEACIAKMKEAKPDGPCRWTVICVGGSPPSEWSKSAAAIFERNYPERLKNSIIYPVPVFMKMIVDAIVYFLPERTKAKFAVISEEAELRELANIPVDGPIELPESLQGGIEGARARDAALQAPSEENGFDMSTLDDETRKAVELQAEKDPALASALHGAKEDELYRLQMQA
jgi:hypothetical protein